MKLIRFFTPAKLLAIPVLASFIIWLIPGTGMYLRGFDERSPLEAGGVLLLGGWYVICLLVVIFAGAAGRAVPPTADMKAAETDPRFEVRFYMVLTVIAAAGVLGAYYTISRVVAIVPAIQTGQANNLSAVLLEGSSIGTLRYAVIVAAPLGAFLAMQKKSSWIMAGLNILLLMAVVLLSSRLSLIMATAIFIYLYVHNKPETRLRLVPTVTVAGVMFILLGIANYTRNAGFYRLFGVENPAMMNVYQIAAYVGSPTQVAVGVARAIFNGRLDVPVDLGAGAQAIVPTFLQTTKGNRAAVTDKGLYGQQVDIAPNLNSNSSFADTYARYGWWGMILTLLVLALAAFLFSHFAQYTSVLVVGAGALGYGFLEYWRAFLFNTGNLVFIMIAILVAAAIARATTPSMHRQFSNRGSQAMKKRLS